MKPSKGLLDYLLFFVKHLTQDIHFNPRLFYNLCNLIIILQEITYQIFLLHMNNDFEHTIPRVMTIFYQLNYMAKYITII